MRVYVLSTIGGVIAPPAGTGLRRQHHGYAIYSLIPVFLLRRPSPARHSRAQLCSSELPNCSALVAETTWKSNLPQYTSHPDAAYLKASALVAELLQLIESAPRSYGSSPPPPYTQNPDEQPPPYLTSESLAYPHGHIAEAALLAPFEKSSQQSVHTPGNAAMVDTIDFGDTSGVQTRGKAAKKAAKKAQQSRWLDDGDEGGGAQNGDDGAGDGGNAGGGDGGSGAGGNDDGGGGDDNNDDWGYGGKKNKKNKKKKQEEEEKKKQEEEEKKKQEEEEAKKKEEEDAAAAAAGDNGGNFLNWADDVNEANADDDWAGFTTTKTKDKKKKGKKVNFTLYIARFISNFTYRIRKQQLLPLHMQTQLQRSTT